MTTLPSARRLACAAAGIALAASAAHAATPTPRILGITLQATAPGLYSATITGTNFGAAPAGVPCTACTPLALQIVDIATQPRRLALDVTAWSDTSVTVANLPAAAGTALRATIYNAALGTTESWAGLTARNRTLPVITGIATAGSGATRTITITGSGFGPAPAAVGSTANTPYLVVTTFNRAAPFTDGFPWNAGFCGMTDCNGVTTTYTSWSDTQIVIGGFGGLYGNGAWTANPGDNICVGVWPSTSTSNGTTGGRYRCARLPSR